MKTKFSSTAMDSSLTTVKTAIEFKGVDFHLEKFPHKT